MELSPIAKFNVTSGAVRLTDPCYANDVWCKLVVPNVRNGIWQGFVAQELGEPGWGPAGHKRNMAVVALHESLGVIEPNDAGWEFFEANDPKNKSSEVGVDSGQAGIFDDEPYAKGPGIKEGEYDDPSSFYGQACSATCEGINAGVIQRMGIVSASGYGDGGYDAYVFERDGKVLGVMVDFGLFAEDETDDGTNEDDEELVS